MKSSYSPTVISRVLSAKDGRGDAVGGCGELRRLAGRALGGLALEQPRVVGAGDGEVDKVQPQLAHVRLALADLQRVMCQYQLDKSKSFVALPWQCRANCPFWPGCW